MSTVRVGTAGWSIPGAHSEAIQSVGSHLERYARTFSCVEINSTFYRPSRESTWRRWAASVPDDFRFSVKAPKALTHESALGLTPETRDALSAFLEQARLLGPKLGPLLFQLPPKQVFDELRAAAFFNQVRALHNGDIVLEPRHASWFQPEPESLLAGLRIARAAADPARVVQAAKPGGASSPLYYRLHGSPRMYYSPYSVEFLVSLAVSLRDRPAQTEAWVVFDNTASGAALGNALTLLSELRDT